MPPGCMRAMRLFPALSLGLKRGEVGLGATIFAWYSGRVLSPRWPFTAVPEQK